MDAGMASAEAKAAAALGGLSGPDTLIIGGAALFLIVGEILIGELFSNGGITLSGALAGEVLFFTWLTRPKPGRSTLLSIGVIQAIVAAFVIAIVLFEVGDFITTIKNLSGFTALGFASILVTLCRWAGAVLMGLGVVSAWSPGPATPAPRV
jgi:hypothetical protein